MKNPRLRERRERLGLSQRQLAEACGAPVHQATVSAAELDPGRHATSVNRVRRALIRLELERRMNRQLDASREAWHAEEQCRIERQEALWAAVPDSPAKLVLQAAMLDRCLELMHHGMGSETDAIAEWLPRLLVDRMFEQWETERLADRLCLCCSPVELVHG